jgi:hypothetical protein
MIYLGWKKEEEKEANQVNTRQNEEPGIMLILPTYA